MSDLDVEVLILADQPSRPIDRRVFGTNVPAWLGPDRLADPAFRQATVDSGATVVRMPGGSWSNGYDWAACERRDENGCFATWAARPSDFADYLAGTGLEGMWTVSINHTAQHSAAAVAFFNGEVGDDRVIGVDRNGVDWGTVGEWAELRAADGLSEPVRVGLWEVGNEVFGGRPDAGGEQCAEFGWEDVWTCDGEEYVNGRDDYDGYLTIREAMLDVDPTIEVGAVGVSDPASWSDWGNEVIAGAGAQLDFYVVHQYGFDASPSGDDAIERPAAMWPEVIGLARSALPDGVSVAVTEYNLVSFEAGDTDRAMTRAMNALYVADTLGQLITAGVGIANQWNLANGTTESGTDYGLIDADDGTPFPQHVGFRLWARTGDELLTHEIDGPDDVRFYPTRRPDGSIVAVLLNLGGDPLTLAVGVAGFDTPIAGTLSSWRAETLDAESLISDPRAPIAADGATTTVTLPARSLNLLEIASNA